MNTTAVINRRKMELAALGLMFPQYSHDLCLVGDWEGVAAQLRATGRTASEAGNALHEFRAFYTAGADCL